MELELHLVEVVPERRWNWLVEERQAGAPQHCFFSYEDQSTIVVLREPGQPLRASTFVRRSSVLRLAPSIGSTITVPEQVAELSDPVLEYRRYRVRPGTRARFAAFLRDRTLDEQRRLGMNVHGPFDLLDEEATLIWFRGFPSLLERDRRKAAFYQGRTWVEELEEEAFSMIEDYSVILLSPVS